MGQQAGRRFGLCLQLRTPSAILVDELDAVHNANARSHVHGFFAVGRPDLHSETQIRGSE